MCFLNEIMLIKAFFKKYYVDILLYVLWFYEYDYNKHIILAHWGLFYPTNNKPTPL